MIKTNRELFARVEEISRRLRDGNEEALASNILKTLSFSSVPGELFGGMRVRFEKLQREDATKRLGMAGDVSEVLEALYRVR